MNEMILHGPNGRNTLGFLSACGAFRLIALDYPDVTLRWIRKNQWTPVLGFSQPVTRDEVFDKLLARLKTEDPFFQLPQPDGGKDEVVNRAALHEFIQANPDNPYIYAYGNEMHGQAEKAHRMATSPFIVFNGGSLQCYFPNVRKLRRVVRQTDLEKVLNSPVWDRSPAAIEEFPPFVPPEGTKQEVREAKKKYQQDKKDFDERTAMLSTSLGFDTEDLSVTSNLKGDLAPLPAAHLLAHEALPLFPVMHGDRRPQVVGWQRYGQHWTWTWPLWDRPLTLPVVEMLLADPVLQQPKLDWAALRRRGIVQTGRAYRVKNPANPHQTRLALRW